MAAKDVKFSGEARERTLWRVRVLNAGLRWVNRAKCFWRCRRGTARR
jgi:hypothetical protein